MANQIVNMNRVRQVARDEYQLFDLVRDGENDYCPPVYGSREEADSDARYGAWYIEDAEGDMRGPYLSEHEAQKAAKKLEEATS